MTAETGGPETGLDFTRVSKSASAGPMSSVKKALLASRSNICWGSVASASPATAGPDCGASAWAGGWGWTVFVGAASGVVASLPALEALGGPDGSHPAAQMSRALSRAALRYMRGVRACFFGEKRAAIIGRNLQKKP